jgi:macrolide transport system ATP-binding/permease protein
LPGVDTAALMEFDQVSQFGAFTFSYPDYVDYRTRAQTVALAGREQYAMHVGTGNAVERVWGELVTDNYFDVLGVRPVLGRGFVESDIKAGAPPVVVISDAFWKRRFAADPSVLGRSLPINGRPFTIVGVTPHEFIGSEMGLRLELFVPLNAVEVVVAGGNRLVSRGAHWFDGVARLRSGATVEQARDELNAITVAMTDTVPEYKGVKARLTPFWESTKGRISILRPVLFAMLAVGGLVLLVACANVANLLLVRAASRRQEIAIRLSIGATRGRLIRQLMTEGLVLAVLGAVGGIAVTQFTAGLLNQFVPPSELPISIDVPLDARVLAFALLATMTATVLFALAPAVRLSAARSSEALKRVRVADSGRGRFRDGLVVIQVALSLALVVAAGLCLTSLNRVRSFNPGFDKAGMLLASIDLFPAGYDAPTGTQVLSRIDDALGALPGVTSHTLARHVPLGFTGLNSSSIEVDGRTRVEGEPLLVAVTTVGPGYLHVMGIPLVSGRDIRRSDESGAPPIAVVSEAMAARYWPDRDAVGGRFRFGATEPWITVAGVARDTKWRDLREDARSFVYLPVLQSYHPSTVIHLRTSGDPSLLTGAVREAVGAVAPGLPVFSIRTLEGQVSAAFSPSPSPRSASTAYSPSSSDNAREKSAFVSPLARRRATCSRWSFVKDCY